jgi:ABC-type sugar transport system substrate-binding protein
MLRVILFLIFFATSLHAKERVPKVTFISPDPRTELDFFWTDFIKLMQKASRDLKIDFKVHLSKGDRFTALEDIKNVIDSKDKPDFLIYLAFRDGVEESLKYAEENGVYTILVNSKLYYTDSLKVKKPREKFKKWLGTIYPDDFMAGYLQLKTLHESLSNDRKKKQINLLAITGDLNSAGPQERIDGMKKYVKENSNINLLQIINGKWSYDYAKKIIPHIHERHPKVDIVWTTGGLMTLAFAEHYKKLNPKSKIGGIDWSRPEIKAYNKNIITSLIGGHVFEGAWSLVLIKDFWNDIDFIKDTGPLIKTKMTTLKESRKNKSKGFFLNKRWMNIDFKTYSKFFNKEIKRYNFSI